MYRAYPAGSSHTWDWGGAIARTRRMRIGAPAGVSTYSGHSDMAGGAESTSRCGLAEDAVGARPEQLQCSGGRIPLALRSGQLNRQDVQGLAGRECSQEK